MFKIEHFVPNCAYFSKDVRMQEFAFDTICMCTCGKHVADMHASRGCPDVQRPHAHTHSQSAQHMALWIQDWPDPVRSWNPEICQNLDFWPKVDFLAILAISGSDTGSGQNPVWTPIWPESAKLRVWPDLARSAVRTNFPGFRRSGQLWPKLADLPESPKSWLRPQNLGPRVLYIDHFQLPPWWKMTGEEGDPFRGPRWHWPSKRRDFEKNLLITKSRIQPEKRTFFSFTPKNGRKSAVFLTPELKKCPLLRSSISSWYSTFFRLFWGSKIPKILHFFSTFLGPQKSWFFGLRTNFRTFWPNPPNPEISRFWRFWPDTYGGTWMAKISRFSRFCQKVEILSIFEILALSALFPKIQQNLEKSTFSGHVRKCPKVAILDTSNCSTLRSQNLNFRTLSGHKFRDLTGVIGPNMWVVICAIFLSFLCAKKLEKYISLASTTLVTAG